MPFLFHFSISNVFLLVMYNTLRLDDIHDCPESVNLYTGVSKEEDIPKLMLAADLQPETEFATTCKVYIQLQLMIQ